MYNWITLLYAWSTVNQLHYNNFFKIYALWKCSTQHRISFTHSIRISQASNVNQNSAKVLDNSREKNRYGYCSPGANVKFLLLGKMIQWIIKRGDWKKASLYTETLNLVKASCQPLSLPYSQLSLIPCSGSTCSRLTSSPVSWVLWLLVFWCKGPGTGTPPLRSVQCSPVPQTTPNTHIRHLLPCLMDERLRTSPGAQAWPSPHQASWLHSACRKENATDKIPCSHGI